MEILPIVIVLLAGLVAGFVNTVSAAGSLITLPAFIFVGLSAGQANATNRVAIMAQNFFTSYGFQTKGLKPEKYMWVLAAATVPGAILGAWFALNIPDALFNKILSGVMLVFLVVAIVNPLKSAVGSKELVDRNRKIIGVILYFFIGIYGGFIQAGSGFFLMAGCMLLHKFDIIKTNYYKAIIMLTYTVAAFLVFLFKGDIQWGYGVLMSIGTSAGGYIASRWSVTADEKWIKRAMVIIISTLSVYLWFFK